LPKVINNLKAKFCIFVSEMFNSRFYIGWLLSATLMYLAFYLFHGILTNDLLKLTIPKTVFLSVAAFVYLMVAFGMSVSFKSTTLKKNIRLPFKRALLIGILSALFLYAVAFVVGVSFSYQITLLNAMVDISWQLIEQCLGAFVVSIANTLFYREEEAHTNFM
jgi:hypothetical protein